jgi:hypothetical protein
MKRSVSYDKQKLSITDTSCLRVGVMPQQKYPLTLAGLLKRWATGWTAEVEFPAGVTNFSLVHSVQTGSKAQPVSYPMGTGGCFPGNKAAEVKKGGAIPSLFHTPSWRSA